jgi:hypothetical protein
VSVEGTRERVRGAVPAKHDVHELAPVSEYLPVPHIQASAHPFHTLSRACCMFPHAYDSSSKAGRRGAGRGSKPHTHACAHDGSSEGAVSVEGNQERVQGAVPASQDVQVSDEMAAVVSEYLPVPHIQASAHPFYTLRVKPGLHYTQIREPTEP